MLEEHLAEIYRAICIYINPKVFLKLNIDDLVENPHIHLIHSQHISNDMNHIRLKDFKGSPNTLYQWGDLTALRLKNRSAIVTEEERLKYGSIGLGSVARGNEILNNFVGGGEGIIWSNVGYRVINDGRIINLNLHDKYWFLQVSSFINPISIKNIKGISKREDIPNIVHSLIKKDISFLATFECQFSANSVVMRSNGIFPEDNIKKTRKLNTSFLGGHLLNSQSLYCNFLGPICVEPLYNLQVVNERTCIAL